ncbi:MAG: NifB/NifX family molybdenum-iron cluster-binding protein [Spirochaetes bacterium]|nr:NifB/NifX family molybdenum-iron cluster-binding protein [Spirochaetota bacterium]
MKIVISTDGDNVSAHFGRCPEFTIVDIDGGKVISKEVIGNPGHSPGYLPQFFHEKEVECIITGGMGGNAQNLFNQYNIRQYVGVSGKIDSVIAQALSGTLNGGESLCSPGGGRGYGVDKAGGCDHGGNHSHHNH